MEIGLWSALQILIAAFILLVLPVLTGNAVCALLSLKGGEVNKSFAKSFVYGTVTMWALCELVSVPLILLKVDFLILVIALSVFYVVLTAYGIYKKSFVKLLPQLDGMKEFTAFLVAAVAAVALITFVATLQHTDADDSRFVVNAVDMVTTRRMFLTNPATGEAISSWSGELSKDIFSPWACFMAYVSFVSGIKATVIAHMFLPIALFVSVCMIYWLISGVLFNDNMTARAALIVGVLLLHVFGGYSVYSSETFALTRIWQGKAVAASFAVPVLIWLLIEIFKAPSAKAGREFFIMLAVCSVGFPLLSGMGIIITLLMIGCYGLCYGLAKKSIKLMLLIWLTAVPAGLIFVGYYLEYLMRK
ncbi:MAG: hypothetical protein IKO61_11615 [Lachnospiraceae bacterium]|nr:hypothetical protein [Lachnospiraceae bacterium]